MFGSVGSDWCKWCGGVLVNETIICIPQSTAVVLVIDPHSWSVTCVACPCFGKLQWGGGALASDGNIYCAPVSANDVLCINPLTIIHPIHVETQHGTLPRNKDTLLAHAQEEHSIP